MKNKYGSKYTYPLKSHFCTTVEFHRSGNRFLKYNTRKNLNRDERTEEVKYKVGWMASKKQVLKV